MPEPRRTTARGAWQIVRENLVAEIDRVTAWCGSIGPHDAHEGCEGMPKVSVELDNPPSGDPAVTAWPDVPEHVIVDASERMDYEQRWGLTYCRRCGRAVVNDRYPDKTTKRPCEVVRVSFR